MKKIYSVVAALAATLALAACSGIEIENSAADSVDPGLELIENGNMEVTFNCTMEDEEDPLTTKTEFHDNAIWWSAGDKLLIAQNAMIDNVSAYKGVTFTISSSCPSFSVAVSSFNRPDNGTDAAYFSVYPYGAYASRTTSSGVVYPRITLPSTQSPSADRFDSAADLMISQYAMNLERGDDGKYTVKLKYKRMAAIAKMTIKNLPSSSEIASVEFSAEKSDKAVALAGSRFYDLVNGTPSNLTSSSCFSESKISLDYSTQNIVANSSTGMTAYFMCYPFELASGDSFKVVVKTKAGDIYTKDVTIPSAHEIKFEEGRGTKFSVDMSTAEKGCDWFKVSKSSNASTYNTVYGRIESLNDVTIASVKRCWVMKSEFASIANLDDYVEANGVALAATGTGSIASINAGKAITLSNTGNLDTEYVLIVKAVDADSNSVILTLESKTTWFGVRAVASSTAAKVNGYFYGANIESMSYKMVSAASLEGKEKSEYEEYFNGITASDGASKLSDINSAGFSGKGYAFSVTSGNKYILLAKAVNAKGESIFAYSSEVTAK